MSATLTEAIDNEGVGLLQRGSNIESYQQDPPISAEWAAKPRALVGELVSQDQRRRRIEWIKIGVAFGTALVSSALAWGVGVRSSPTSLWDLVPPLGISVALVSSGLGVAFLIERWTSGRISKSAREICAIVMDDSRLQKLIKRLLSESLKEFCIPKSPDTMQRLDVMDLKEFDIITPETCKKVGMLVALRQQIDPLHQYQPKEYFTNIEERLEAQWRQVQQEDIARDVARIRQAQV